MSLLVVFSSLFYVSDILGQGSGNTPADLYSETPVKHWGNQNGTLEKEWSFDVKQTCDGGYIVCGFSVRNTIDRPAIIKYDVDGEIEWEFIYSSLSGRLWEIVATTDEHYAAIGETSDKKIFFIKVNFDGVAIVGPSVIGFPTNYSANNTRGSSIQMVSDNSPVGYGFIVAGNTAGPQVGISHPNGPNGTVSNKGGQDMMLLRLDANGNYLWSNNFGGSGSFDQGNGVTVLPNNGGFVIVGRRTEVYQVNGYAANILVGCGGLTDNQAFIVKTDINGNPLWETSIDATGGVRDINDNPITTYTNNTPIDFGNAFFKYEQFTDCYSGGFDYEGSNETDIPGGPCSASGCANTSNDNAIDVLVDDNGDIVLSSYFHYNDNDNSQASTCDPSNGCVQLELYKEADIVLVKLRENDGYPIFAENVAYFSGVDFNARLAEDSRDGGYAIIGATANTSDLIEEGDTNNGGGIINSYLVKTNNNGQRLWARAYNDPANINSCSFGIAATSDGGYITVGNNNVDKDNRIAVKLYDDCEPNFQFSQGFEPSPLSVTSESAPIYDGNIPSDRTIGAHIVVENGKELIIHNGVILEFADTRQLNDYDDLATNDPFEIHKAGITVMPGGKLTIRDGARLLGILCNGRRMWEGIEVLTDPVTGLTGEVDIQGTANWGVIIENALVGIRAAPMEYDAKGRPRSMTNLGANELVGGSLDIRGTVFRNNLIDIDIAGSTAFQPIQTVSTYSIDECQFLATAALLDPNFIGDKSIYFNNQAPYNVVDDCERWGNQIHIRMVGVGSLAESVEITKSTFDNSRFYGNRGVGIESKFSSLRVEDACIFNELHFGIFATYNPFSPRNFEVGNLGMTANQFNNNLWGTYVLGNPPTFVYQNNNIDIDNLTPMNPLYSNNYLYGLYIDGTTEYLVEQNKFLSTGITNIYGIGVFANNTWHHNDNWVENNDFSNMFVGVTGHLVNGIDDPDRGGVGLKIECNTYTDNQFDEFVLSQGSIAGSIHPNQGEFVTLLADNSNEAAWLAAPAGNRFSNCWGGGLDTHIAASSNADMFNYFYHDTNDYRPQPCFNDNIVNDVFSDAPYTNNISCEETGGLKNMSTTSIETQLATDKATLIQLKANNGDQNEISRLENGRELAIKILMRKFLKNNQISDAVRFLETETTPEAHVRLIPLYLSQQDYTKANASLTALPSHTTAWQQYKDLAQIAINLQQNGLAYGDMNSTQEQTVRNIAATNTVYANHAKGILYQAFGETYDIDNPIFPSQSSKRSNASESNTKILQLMPNPANQQIQIVWTNTAKNITQISIYNLIGEKLVTIPIIADERSKNIDINSFPNGLYLVSIEGNGAIIAQEKLAISK